MTAGRLLLLVALLLASVWLVWLAAFNVLRLVRMLFRELLFAELQVAFVANEDPELH